MLDMQTQFQEASQDVIKLSKAPDADVKLKLYALYKQGTQGDCTGARPGMLDFVGRAKYDSWKMLEGMSQEEAMREYIDLVARLKTDDEE